MSSGPLSEYDIVTMFTQIDTKLDALIKAHDESREWQREHEKQDRLEIANINKSITTMYRFAAAITAVGIGIGAILSSIPVLNSILGLAPSIKG